MQLFRQSLVPKPEPFVFKFRGVVVARNDPERRQRVRVRVAGIHSQEAPVETLPWAMPTEGQRGDRWGALGVPPLGTWLWIEFDQGDHEYPLYGGSCFGSDQCPDGTGVNASRVWPSVATSDPHPDGILAAEDGAGSGLSPDVFGWLSPLQKRFFLDDSDTRQRILIGDRHDNMLWVNSEHGVVTMEAAAGERREVPRPCGFTLSTDQQGAQIYSFRGWRLTLLDSGYGELSSPAGAMFRITDTALKRGVDVWSQSGQRVTLDDVNLSAEVGLADGTSVRLSNGEATLQSRDRKSYVTVSREFVEIFSEGDVRIKSGGVFSVEAHKKVTIDSRDPIELDPREGNLGSLSPLQDSFVRVTYPERLGRMVRACDYGYYSP